MFVERFAGGSSPPHPAHVSHVSPSLLQTPGAPMPRALLSPAGFLEACLHLLLSFLTSNFPSNPLLPDSLFSIERLSLRPVASSCAISCCAQVPRAAHLHRGAAGIAHRPCRLKKRRLRTPRPPAQGPHAAQREDPTLPSARTLRRPARGPYDTLQPSWIRPKSSSGFLRGTLDTRKQTTCPQDPPTVNPSTATGTPCTFPVGHAGPKTLDPGLPSSRETHLLTDELH
ncbi:uncharacterized protein LOC116080970 isoform X3 [Mastomys coucha]|uniref:uncharacterized protein LOC116080970 isoform X3 n=1 Tax=Mastomys coucha TaxID=35658 RepID=UPI00126159AA|nr:uncharacterized protein LOC116080970 isoform X3 [Mastomys coucha]